MIKIIPNPKQQECIDSVEGSVMVLAGPGTGKTFTIVHRLEYMILKGIKPESVLCLTFTDVAANEMKTRLLKNIGAKASNVNITTYHSFCNDIIRRYPSKFELLDGVKLVDDISKRTILKECLDEYKPKAFVTKWGDYYHFIPDILGLIDEIKKNLITKEQYLSNLNNHPDWTPKLQVMEEEHKERIEKNRPLKTFLSQKETQIKKIERAKEAWELYELYIKKLAQYNFIDFNDMINFIINAFETDENFLTEVSKEYQYFLVDEYQDTNLLQNRILFNLSKGSKSENIFVVGDDDQIIYGFQGAKIDNLERFLTKFKDTKVICLNENNRSTQNILDLSYAIISQDEYRLEVNPKFKDYHIDKKLTAKNKTVIEKTKKVELKAFKDNIQEQNAIVSKIKDIIEKKDLTLNKKGELDLAQIAILARKHNELDEYIRLLEAEDITFQVKRTKSIFEIKVSILIYFYLKALANSYKYSDKLFGLLLSEPFNFNLEDYKFLMEAQKPYPKDFITLIKENIEREWKDKDKVIDFIKTYDELRNLKSHKNLRNLIIDVINNTKILSYYTKSDLNKTENILAIKRLTDEAASFQSLYKSANLNDFILHLDTAFEKGLAINIEPDETTQNAVQLLTIHGSKGKEFEHVFMPNLIADNWEKDRGKDGVKLPIEPPDEPKDCRDKKDIKKSEQLKLFFVGITRAKYGLNLSYANSIDGKSKTLTQYLSVTSELPDIVNAEIVEYQDTTYLDEIVKSLSKKNVQTYKKFEKELKDRLENFVLSANSLNSYLNCPRGFLYGNIYKIPVYDLETANRDYGSAIHKTIEWATEIAKEKNEYPTKSEVLEYFDSKIQNYQFDSEIKFEEYKTRGEKCLEGYYHRLIATNPKNIFDTEKNLGVVEFENFKLTGIIDKIEETKDGKYYVFDYKTGSAKKEKDITNDGKNENYYNQLGIYKLAFEKKYPDKKIEQVGLIFVEEPENSVYMALNENDEKIITEKITQTIENIKQLKFEPIDKNGTKHENCKYCNYKMLCTLDVL